MDVGYSNKVIARDSFGRFISDVENAARESVKAAIEEGADLSRAMAPSGKKDDPRTVKLKESISTEMLSRTSGRWFSRARHALPIEFGAGPHDITGDVSFFWEREGRNWVPGDNTIHHPGNAAQPYLRPAYREISAKLLSIMSRYYPG